MLNLMPQPRPVHPLEYRNGLRQIHSTHHATPVRLPPEAGAFVIRRVNPARLGLSLALTAGLLYLLCALMVALAPGAFSAVLGLVAHGLNIAPLTQLVAPISLPAVLVGLLVLMAYSFIAGLLFGLVNNIGQRST